LNVLQDFKWNVLIGNWLLLSLHTFLSPNLGSPLRTTLLLSQRVLCSVGHVPVTASGCQSLVEDVLHDFTLPSSREFADSWPSYLPSSPENIPEFVIFSCHLTRSQTAAEANAIRVFSKERKYIKQERVLKKTRFTMKCNWISSHVKYWKDVQRCKSALYLGSMLVKVHNEESPIIGLIFFFYEPTAPSGPGPPHYRGFAITLRHTTFSRTPLDDAETPTWQHITLKRDRRPCPWRDSNLQSPTSERPQTHTLDRAVVGLYSSPNVLGWSHNGRWGGWNT